MIRFAALYQMLDSTTKTGEKVAAITEYLSSAPPQDAAWAVYFLTGNRPRRLVPTKLLRLWAAEAANIPDWLVEESYHAVGDLAETLSLLVPDGVGGNQQTLAKWMEERLLPLRGMEEAEQKKAVLSLWKETPPEIRFVTLKLMTGAFRVGVGKRLVTRALSELCNLPIEVIAHRLMGNYFDDRPEAEMFLRLIDPEHNETSVSKPYPFCLAHALDQDPATLGNLSEYSAEWKWDGIRGQLIHRNDQTFIWSRGEELMAGKWPEIESAAIGLPNGTVLDGEILASLSDGVVLPFSQLQRRIGRKSVGKKLLAEVPVVFFAFDLLEAEGQDLRALPFSQRRLQLEAVLDKHSDPHHIRPTRLLEFGSWEELAAIRETSRKQQAEGLMLKRRDSRYETGRVRGSWWKWKIDPHTIDAVLIYAQKGHGRRSNLFTDYTFALWKGDQLVPFAKAYSGLSDEEIRQVDRFVRDNTHDSFGPVRSVEPQLVMELAFEGLQRSTRHKSGVATRFPRIVRWRHDKGPRDANSLDELLELLPV